MKIRDTPQIDILQSGDAVKILQVTGTEGMVIPEHYCTAEAVLVIQKGSAILEMEGNAYALSRDQPFIIPGGTSHSLNIRESFQALVMMSINSEIEFLSK